MPNNLDELVDTFYRAFCGETDLLDRAVTPDWADIPPSPGQGPGPEGFKLIINGMSETFSGLRVVVKDVVDGRDSDGNGRIAVRAEMVGTHTGEIFGIAPTGQDVVIPLHEFHEVRDGKVACTWHQEDWLGFFLQIGRAPRIATARERR